MSNHFRLHSNHTNTDEWLSMSNGGTTGFLTVLGLSGSSIAITDKEKEFVIWIIEHDQTVYGLGNAGFDIAEMPWDYLNFENERRFILNVIDGAKQKIGWETLDYQPSEDRIFSYLDSFHRLICCFDSKYINREAYSKWVREQDKLQYQLPDGYPNCGERERELGLDSINDYNQNINSFEQHLDKDVYAKWSKEQAFPKIKLPEGFHKCRKHDILLYWHGCIACNDM